MITMFKNEAKTILRMLESCYKYFDYFIFQDNGSTDGTPQLVAEFCNERQLNGFIYQVEEGWVGFGWNRDHLLQTCLKSDHGCDWIIKMDCDEYLEVDEDFDWSVFDDTNIQSFHVPAIAPGLTYYRAWIWNAKLPWKFNHSLIHETISLEMDGIGENFQRVNLPLSFRQIGTNDGESYLAPTKYVSDALKLEEEMIRENTLLKDDYHFWYIGKIYYDSFKCETFPLGQSQQM
jgi:glycosyltransferase involved in cell wall biosynthesis